LKTFGKVCSSSSSSSFLFLRIPPSSVLPLSSYSTFPFPLPSLALALGIALLLVLFLYFIFFLFQYVYPVRKADYSGFLNSWSLILQESPSEFCDFFFFFSTRDKLTEDNYSLLFSSPCQSDTLLLFKLEPQLRISHLNWFNRCLEFNGTPLPSLLSPPSSSSSSSSSSLKRSCTVCWPVDLSENNIWTPLYEDKGNYSEVPFKFRFVKPSSEGIPQAM
jgi:hypothetical protein